MVSRKRSGRHPPLKLARGTVKHVHQLLVVLRDTDPLVWRRIQVPEDYSFWDLHVAIQDAMGWQDSHLHEFNVFNPTRQQMERIGIPDQEVPEDRPCLPDWEVTVTPYLEEDGPPIVYTYDFGDDWRHVIVYEGTWPARARGRFPACLAGARACPPEDCGGAHRYRELLAALTNPKDPDHGEILEWLGPDFAPDVFNAKTVRFADPAVRWNAAFGESAV